VFGAEGESSHNWETILKELWEREVRRVRLFISDDLPGIEEAIRRIFPQATWQLCMVHAVRDALSKVREDEREEMAKDLKHLVGGHGKGSPQGSGGVQKQMGVEISQDRGQVSHQKLCLVGVSGASQTDPALPLCHTTNQLERLIKEVKRRVRTVKIFCNPGRWRSFYTRCCPRWRGSLRGDRLDSRNYRWKAAIPPRHNKRDTTFRTLPT